MPVTLTLTAPAGFTVRTATDTGQGTHHAAGPHAGSARDFALVALRHCKFEDPESIIDLYRPERILDVCYSALHYKHKLANKTGYIYQALKQGWEVRPRRPQADT
jgi:hypothetical protein